MPNVKLASSSAVDRCWNFLLPLIALSTLAGCSDISPRFRLAAQDLSPAFTDRPKDQSKEIHLLVQESQQKCSAFVNSLFAENALTNFGLDAAGATTSALATVFTSIPVTHALSAATSVFGAAKTSISTNYLNALTISHITQAIQATYNTDIQKYLSYLQTSNPASLDYYAERDLIQSYHGECSLAAAEGSLSSSISPAPAVAPQPYTFSYTVPNGRNLAKVVPDFISRFNVSAFRTGGVTAQIAGNSGQISLLMSTPLTFSATATPGGTGHIAVSVDNTTTPPTLTLSGTTSQGDVITVTGQPAKQTSTTTGTAPSPAAPPAAPSVPAPPPAALPGRNPAVGSSPPSP